MCVELSGKERKKTTHGAVKDRGGGGKKGKKLSEYGRVRFLFFVLLFFFWQEKKKRQGGRGMCDGGGVGAQGSAKKDRWNEREA